MDALSAMLEAVRIRGSLYFWTSLTPPWGVRVPPFVHVIRYHLVIRGHCWVRVEGRPDAIRLEPGDLIAVPHGRAHLLSDGSKTLCGSLDDLIARSGFTGEGALVVGDPDDARATRMVCGHFAYDADEEHPLFRALPSAIVVRGVIGPESEWLDQLLQFISREVTRDGPGTRAIVTRLAEIVFVHTLRTFAEQHPEHGIGWAGFVDRHVGPALARIHERPEEAWTVATLSREAGLSRTRFAMRFRELMGTSPLAYLTSWRLLSAKSWLARTDDGVAAVAGRVGYQSEAAFNRAFTKRFGVGPGAFRRRSRAASAASTSSVAVKRAYEAPAAADGTRVLVDRLWPRGLRKDRARIDLWMKELAPSDALRRWFGHDPARWTGFQRRYHAELGRQSAATSRLREIVGRGPVTLVFAASDTAHNNARALAAWLETPTS